MTYKTEDMEVLDLVLSLGVSCLDDFLHKTSALDLLDVLLKNQGLSGPTFKKKCNAKATLRQCDECRKIINIQTLFFNF